MRRAAKLAGLCMNSTASVGSGSIRSEMMRAALCLCAALGDRAQRIVQACVDADAQRLVIDPHHSLVAYAGTLTMTGRDSAGRLGPDRNHGLTMTTMSAPSISATST